MSSSFTPQFARGTSSANANDSRPAAAVMDVLPWPNGCGFSGGDSWWRDVLSQSERERLDNLMGLALLDKKVCEQLVTNCDPALLSAFGISEPIQDWLRRIGATTLTELSQAITTATDRAQVDFITTKSV